MVATFDIVITLTLSASKATSLRVATMACTFSGRRSAQSVNRISSENQSSPNCKDAAGTDIVCGRLNPLVTTTDVPPDLATSKTANELYF
jgi:hypothetical protein